MTKLEQLKEMVARWEKEKSILLAYDICEFLSKNLEKSDGEKEKSSPEG